MLNLSIPERNSYVQNRDQNPISQHVQVKNTADI